jgi:hypothetical protein
MASRQPANRRRSETFTGSATRPARARCRRKVVSGCDRNGQQLGCPHLVGNWLAIGLQAGDVDLNGLDCSLPAFLDRAATGKAPRQDRDGHEVATAVLGLHNDCVRAHRIHIVTTPPVVAPR